jgi:hypothetical protein
LPIFSGEGVFGLSLEGDFNDFVATPNLKFLVTLSLEWVCLENVAKSTTISKRLVKTKKY